MKLKREAFGDCIAEVAAKAGVDDDAAFDILQTVADHGEKMRASGQPNPFSAAAADIAQKTRESAALDRADALRNAVKRNSILQNIRDGGGVRQAALELQSDMYGTNRGHRDSVQSRWRGNAAAWTGVLSNKLRQMGLEKAAISGELDEQIADAIWSLNAKTPMPSSVGKAAKDIAEAIHPLLDHVKDRLNAEGARIGDAVDYAGHTSHDPERLRMAAGAGASPEAAFKAWWAFTRPLLGDKTFDDIEPRSGESVEGARDRFGWAFYRALRTGDHLQPQGQFGIADPEQRAPPKFEGTYNIARKASSPRVAHWKDGAAWNTYMKQFGKPTSLTDGVMQTLDSSARQLALMEKFGTNPQGNLNMIADSLKREYKDDIDGIGAFKAKLDGLNNAMAHLDGRANIPANEFAARVGASIRTLESVSSLGSVGITHFASIWPTVTSELTHHGVSRLDSLGAMVHAITTGAGDAGRREAMADLGAYAAGLNRDMQGRWQADDPVPGKIGSMANTFMKYTGIHYVYDQAQASIRWLLANQLGRNVDSAFGELHPSLQAMLTRYGIGSGDWDVLRSVPDIPTVDGRAYMGGSVAARTDSTAIRDLLQARGALPEEASDDVTDRAIRNYQWDLGDKLMSYYSDAAAHGVVTPGVQERAFALGGERPGSLGGEWRRYFWQFKMWPLAAMNQILHREIYLATSKGQAAFNIGSMLAMTTAAGYLRMTINDIATGNPPRRATDPRTLIAALAQGGGIGIVGDFLFGEVNRMGGDLLSTAAGPVIGDANQLFKIYTRFREDAASDDPDARAKALEHAWPDTLRFGIKHIPFANLIYLKGALDYMLWYHLYEAASPGWWDRTNARMEKESGRTMVGYTPGGQIPYGVPGVYLGGTGAPPSGALAHLQ